MPRYSLPAIGLSGILLAGTAGALELGDIRVISNEDEPFKADIELLDVGTLKPLDIAVKLASESEYQYAQLNRREFLNSLQYDIILNGRDGGVIQVSSPVAIAEEEWELLLDTTWPSGRQLKQFLVQSSRRNFAADADPMEIEQQAQAEVAVSMAEEAEPEPMVLEGEPDPVISDTPEMMEEAPLEQDEPGLPEAPMQGQGEAEATVQRTPAAATEWPTDLPEQPTTYTTQRGDALWRIASRYKPADDLDIYQTLLAFQELNPHAFVDNNVNKLKTGQVLRFPNEQQVRANSRGDAQREIAAQIHSWEAEKGVISNIAQSDAPQIDARADAANEAAAPVSTSRPSLQLSSNTGAGIQTAVDSDSEERINELTRQLEQALSDLENAQQMSTALGDEVAEKNKVISNLQNKLEVLNAELAELQAEYSNAVAQPAEQPMVEEPVAEAVPEAEAEQADFESPIEDASMESLDDNPDLEFENALEPAAQPQSETIPAVESKTWKDYLFGLPGLATLLGLAAAAALLIFARRKRSEDEEYVEEDFEIDEQRHAHMHDDDDDYIAAGAEIEIEAESSASSLDSESEDYTSEDEDEAFASYDEEAQEVEEEAIDDIEHVLDNAVEGEADYQEDQPDEDEIDDPLKEAEIYMAYGRYPEAVDLLERALEAEPHREDLLQKLTEVHAANGDEDANQQEASKLSDLQEDELALDSELDDSEALEELFEADALALEETLSEIESIGEVEDLNGTSDLSERIPENAASEALSSLDEISHDISVESAQNLLEAGDTVSARRILDSLVSNGTALEKQQARELLSSLG